MYEQPPVVLSYWLFTLHTLLTCSRSRQRGRLRCAPEEEEEEEEEEEVVVVVEEEEEQVVVVVVVVVVELVAGDWRRRKNYASLTGMIGGREAPIASRRPSLVRRRSR